MTLENASNGNAVLGTGTLSNGSYTFNLSGTLLDAGTYNLFAVYGGDHHLGQNSNTATQTVNAAATSTSVSINQVGPYSTTTPVTFTATITPTPTSTVNSGTVSFYINSISPANLIGMPVNVSADTAVSATTTLPAGTDTIIAVYSGTTDYVTSQGSTQVSVGGGSPITISSIAVNGNPTASSALAISSISEGADAADGLNDLVTVTTAGSDGLVTENLVNITGFSGGTPATTGLIRPLSRVSIPSPTSIRTPRHWPAPPAPAPSATPWPATNARWWTASSTPSTSPSRWRRWGLSPSPCNPASASMAGLAARSARCRP